REPGLTYEFPVIDLRTLDPDVLLRSSWIADNFLAALSRGAEPRTVSRAILRRGRRERRPVDPIIDMLLVLFKLRGLGLPEALEVCEMPEVVDLTRFPKLRKSLDLVREKFREEGRQAGLKEGRQEGLEEGRQEAQDEGRRRLLDLLQH